MASQRPHVPRTTLRDLRSPYGTDQTLQNLLRALTLNLELQSRYRVFEFEATQDGQPDAARLFEELQAAGSEHITVLITGLHARLGEELARSQEVS